MKGEKYLFVVSGPSGTGKDTVVAALLKKHPEIQHTPREGEKDGINYHFMSVADFEDHLAHDQIVEHTKYCENYYGTLRSEIEGRMKLGIPVILVIEVEGAGNIKKMYPGATTIFVLTTRRLSASRASPVRSCCRSSSAVCAAAAPRMRRPSSAA